MIIDISEIISTPMKSEIYRIPMDSDGFSLQGMTYPFRESDDFVLVVSNIGMRKLHLEGKWQGTLNVPCDRCLDEVAVPILVELNEERDLNEDASEEQAAVSFLEDGKIDTDILLSHEIQVRFPMKVLCHQDCKGICLNCGKNLNHGECGCDRFVPDPRMAAIQDIFKNFKEV